MANWRCIICEELKDESEFKHGHFTDFCSYCRRLGNDELRRFRYNFQHGIEVFCLRYPDALSTYSVSIPSDNEGKRKMLEEIRERIDSGIRVVTREKEIEERKDASSKRSQGLSNDLFELYRYKAQVIQFEEKYK